MKLKIILGVLVVLFILFVIGILVVGAHLGDIIKAGLEKFGPRITQTSLTVDAVNLSLLGGSAGVKGFVLGNPDGYKTPQSISVSNAAISLVPSSIMSDKIVIRSVELRAPVITFEGNPLGANNLMKIVDNVNAVKGSADKTGATTQTAPPANANANPPAATPANGANPGKKLEVDDFLITGATVHANITGVVNKELTLTLPDIHFTDLGKGPDGITAADLAQKVLTQIQTETVKALASSVNELGKDALNAAKSAAQDTVNKALQGGGTTTSNSLNQLKKGLGGLLGK
jgi:hypothetical protein